MESPAYLLDQFAKTRGASNEMAKRALLMQGYAEDGRTVVDAARLVGISTRSGKLVARRFMIDFADYRPYASLEKQGRPRPQPFVRPQAPPPQGLPLFDGPS